MKEMTKGNLSATALENRVRALRVKIVPTAAAFAEWRKAHEAASAALAPATATQLAGQPVEEAQARRACARPAPAQ